MMMTRLKKDMWVSHLHIVKVVAGGEDDCWVTLTDGSEIHVHKSALHVTNELSLCH
jgi:hypothetical protein